MINKKTKGFTLIETLVAVFILSVSIAGPLTIASRALTAALVAKDQISAFYLAQDAIEYIRFARDTNKLAGGDWLTGVGGTGTVVNISPCQNALGCFLDSAGFSPTVPTVCVASPSCTVTAPNTVAKNLYYDNATRRYTYTVTTDKTFFTRKITITNPLGAQADEALVAATVYWVDTANIVRSVTITENMFNWQ
jgi:prepilin-type N-terminal cleavage/methylation domain-containing protein